MGSSVILPAPGQPKTGPDPAFKTAAIPNIVSFGFEKVGPPSPLYIQRDDVLVLEALSQLPAGDTVRLTARLLQPFAQAAGQPDQPGGVAAGGAIVGPGYVDVVSKDLPIPNPRSLVSTQIVLGEGYLLSLGVSGSSGSLRGATFVRVFLNRGPFSTQTPNVGAMLLADYVTQSAASGWPNGRILSGTEGPGFIAFYTPAGPGAGANFSVLSNISGRVRVNTFAATFTASAAVANRIVTISYSPSNGGGLHYVVQDTVAVTASQVVRYSLGPGASLVRGAGAGTAASPIDVVLPLPSGSFGTTGVVINSQVQNIDINDAWSNILLSTEEWFDSL
jgi:hypothetical protein